MEIEKSELNQHPKGLYILFFTEMWERFSYYGMRALVMLYLTKFFGMTDDNAGKIYGAYTALVYITPIIGGYLADKYIGYLRSVYIGGILMMFGHISLAFESLNFFYLGLLFLILGNGFFKPNISTMLGGLYADRTHLKDSAFTIFYMGINVGGFLGPLLCGYIGEKYNWNYGFGLAGIGMLFGLVNLKLGESRLRGYQFQSLEKNVQIDKTLTEVETDRIKVIVLLAIASGFFWFAFEQMGSSVNLFTDRFVDRNLFGEEIPASTFQSINGLLILAFAPMFASMWTFLSKRQLEPSTPMKFLLGLIFNALSFLALVLGAYFVSGQNSVSMWWIVGFNFLITLGELCLSPVGLSMISKIAPVKLAAVLMGTWFLSNSVAHYISGYVAGKLNQFQSPSHFFLIFVLSSLFAAGVLFLFIKKIRKLMHGIH